MRNSTTTITTVSHYKFHQGNHGSSILYLLLFQKIKLCVVGFSFFSSYIELPKPWKVDQELKKEKRNHLLRDISFTLFFFLIAAFFCLVAFWLFTIGQLKILGNLSKRTTS